MPLSKSTLNNFATSLARNLGARILGLDDNAARILGARPVDHVLGGFLTPSEEEDSGGDSEEILTRDLPTDSAYEQTSVGIEWLCPISSAKAIARVDVDFCVYVRRLPTFSEQRANCVWKRDNADVERHTKAVAVWTRERSTKVSVEIDLALLQKERRITRDISTEVLSALTLDERGLYPGRMPIKFRESDLSNNTSFETRVKELGNAKRPAHWRASIDVRMLVPPSEPDCGRIALRIINRAEKPGIRTLEYVDANLYAVNLGVAIPTAAHRRMVFQELPSSFRYDRSMAGTGINAQLDVETADGHLYFKANTVPQTIVPRLEPRTIEGGMPEFASLSSDPVPLLRKIGEQMDAYKQTVWSAKLTSLEGVELDDATNARDGFEAEIEEFRRGIEVLADSRYSKVGRAFALMNEAMGVAVAPHTSWRLFQIVFIVSRIAGLASREYPELHREGDDKVDILWFAAGGGKTEAFLGLIIWQAFFDRLRGKRIGTSALVRFPLRLLTFQQLQRLARALAAAETIRIREQIQGARFSTGYFVGQSVTPNTVSEELHARYRDIGVDERLQRVFSCPFCRAEVRMHYDDTLRLVEHICTNSQCPGGTGRLPIYVIDDDLYRFVPTIVVATVDKLALLGQNQRFANLLGRFDLLCRRHGVSFRGSNRKLCPAAEQVAGGEIVTECEGTPVDAGPFHDAGPGLLIQDELHLLSEELGTFDAHYETAAMQMSRSFGLQPWKIVGATATIEDYGQQAWQLYLRQARRFPGPGPEAYDSFYYHQNTSLIGRIFVGVLGVGRKHTPAVSRTLTLLYRELQAFRELAAANPAEAAVVYNTGLLTEDEFKELAFLYEVPLTYVLTRKGSDQIAEAIESRVKRELQELAPNHGELLIDTFNGGVDIAEMINTMEQIRTATPAGDPAARIRGLVTTNIIGHGVDVDRFNIIVFAGYTRLVAEYIQASARVGRTFPGISIFVATPQSERDRSIFDRFAKFHEYVDRLVDPAAVNRWPEPALLRTVPGVLCGYLMGVAAARIGRLLPTVESIHQVYGRPGAECLNEQELTTWMLDAYGATHSPSPRYSEVLRTRVRNAFSFIVNTPARQGKPRALNIHLHAMRSLRDIDDPARVEINDPTEVGVLKRFING